jgi:hypothetical protein
MCLAPTTIHSCVFRLSLKVGSIFGAVFETQNASRFATFYRFVTPQTFNIPSQYVTLHVTNDRFGALPPYACALAQTSGVASVIANNRIWNASQLMKSMKDQSRMTLAWKLRRLDEGSRGSMCHCPIRPRHPSRLKHEREIAMMRRREDHTAHTASSQPDIQPASEPRSLVQGQGQGQHH